MAAPTQTPASLPFVKPAGTLILTARDVRVSLDLPTCITAVERAFALNAQGQGLPPAVLGIHAKGGGFHVKAAGLTFSRPFVAVKINANFPANPRNHGLPTIQGVLLLADGETGYPLALMDSMSITAIRTAAATAVAARHLSNPETSKMTILGCGVQAPEQLAALLCVRHPKEIFIYDADPDRARRFAAEQGPRHGMAIESVTDPSSGLRASDIVITCTPSRTPILHEGDVAPGTFVAAVGADNPEKNEIAPSLMAAGRVVVDNLGQCTEIGDLRAAIAAGTMIGADVAAELGEIVVGIKPMTFDPGVVTVFDSTGVALQDVAAAVVAYEHAVTAGRGLTVDFGG